MNRAAVRVINDTIWEGVEAGGIDPALPEGVKKSLASEATFASDKKVVEEGKATLNQIAEKALSQIRSTPNISDESNSVAAQEGQAIINNISARIIALCDAKPLAPTTTSPSVNGARVTKVIPAPVPTVPIRPVAKPAPVLEKQEEKAFVPKVWKKVGPTVKFVPTDSLGGIVGRIEKEERRRSGLVRRTILFFFGVFLSTIKRKRIDHFDSRISDEHYIESTHELVPGEVYALDFFEAKGFVSFAECVAECKRREGLLLGTRGLLAVWEKCRREFPYGRQVFGIDYAEFMWETEVRVGMSTDDMIDVPQKLVEKRYVGFCEYLENCLSNFGVHDVDGPMLNPFILVVKNLS